MRERLFPALTLMALAMVLPELLTGNTPAPVLFTPPVLAFLALAYGVPVLLLRDFAVRAGGGLMTLFMFGLAYGIINEAHLAKTVFRSTGVPVDVYDGYGFRFGIQWAWTAFILPWHAMASLTVPVAITHALWPGCASRPWLGRTALFMLSALMVFLISWFYLFEDDTGLGRSVGMLALLWATFAGLLAAGLFWRGPVLALERNTPIHRPQRIKLWIAGFSGIAPILVMVFAAHWGWPLALYFALVPVFAWFYFRLLKRLDGFGLAGFAWFGLGWLMQIGVFSWIAAAPSFPMIVAIDLAVFSLLYLVVSRGGAQTLHSRRQQAAP